MNRKTGLDQNRIAAIALYATGFFSILFSLIKLYDQDTWFHLAVGRYTAHNGLPTTNTFSSLFAEYPWKNPEWLFDLIAYVVYLVSGFTGVQLLQVLLVVGTFILVTATVLKRREGFGRRELLVYLILLLLVLSASRARFMFRPHLVTYLLFALMIYLAKTRSPRLILWYGTIGFVWSYFHPGVVIGLVLGAIIIFATLMDKDLVQLGKTTIGVILFFLCSILNPYFFLPYSYTYSHLVMEEVTIRPFEFRPPLPGENPTFYFVAFLTILLLPVAFRKKNLFHLIGTAFFLVLAISARRFIPLFFIAALPGLLDGLMDAWEKLRKERVNTFLIAGGTVVAGILVAALLVSDWNRYYRHTIIGLGINEHILPYQACDFVKEQGLTGIMYNDLRFGGFLMWELWPDRPVFQDGRIIPYPPGFLKEMHGKTVPLDSGIWKEYMEKYNVEYALVRRDFLGQDQEIIAPLFERLGWPLVYLDGISAVYVRPGTTNHARTSKFEFTLLGSRLKPLQLYQSGHRDPLAMARELARVPVDSILLPHDALRFTAAALGAGDRSLAIAFAARGETPFNEIEEGLLSLDR